MKKRLLLLALSTHFGLFAAAQEELSLQDCLDYALQNNIQIQKNRVSEEEGTVSLWADKGALFPSLSFSTNQSVGYRPFEENTAIVPHGQVTNTRSKWTYQGSYGLNASWTVWNGGVNRKNIEQQELKNKITQLTTEQSELTIQESITKLYVQILYTQEALKVNEKLQETAQRQYDRGVEMMNQGQMAKADVAQLESQLSTAKYNVVNSHTQIADYKRQLKALLELGVDKSFAVATIIPSDEDVLALIPSAEDAYQAALDTRPEIKSAELSIEEANLALDIARRGFLPSVSMSASMGDSHYSASSKSAGEQMKTNLNMSDGVNVSVPIFDNRRNRSNVKLAKLQKATSQLSLQDQKTTLGSTIEQYWLNASNNQQNYLAAKDRVKSEEASFELLNEQFQNGLKNVVEVMQGRDNLLSAEQDLLQSKYTTLLNIQLLKFYIGDKINL